MSKETKLTPIITKGKKSIQIVDIFTLVMF